MTSAPARIAFSVASAAAREPAIPDGHVDDVVALVAQLCEEHLLVLVALPSDEVGELVPAMGAASLTTGGLELEPGQVGAGQVGREVGRREPEVAVAESHGSEYRAAARGDLDTCKPPASPPDR